MKPQLVQDLTRTREDIPGASDRTGVADYSLANKRVRAKINTTPNRYVRDNERFV